MFSAASGVGRVSKLSAPSLVPPTVQGTLDAQVSSPGVWEELLS